LNRTAGGADVWGAGVSSVRLPRDEFQRVKVDERECGDQHFPTLREARKADVS
jgi:hypothetical protein